MLFGAHVSIAGGIERSPERAGRWGCEVFQTFTRSPQGGPAPELTPDVVERFRASVRRWGLKAHYIHTPYYINFASAAAATRGATVRIVREELERGTVLGSTYVMTHLGSARDVGLKAGLELTVAGLVKVLTGYRGTTQLLIEISAGSGETIGDQFEEVGAIIAATERTLRREHVLNVCFDTQHAFASGYDLRTPAAVRETARRFDDAVGLGRLKLSHCNDSKTGLGSHVDRHENLGRGRLGLDAFRALVAEPRLKRMNLVLETPRDKRGTEIKRELKLLRTLRS